MNNNDVMDAIKIRKDGWITRDRVMAHVEAISLLALQGKIKKPKGHWKWRKCPICGSHVTTGLYEFSDAYYYCTNEDCDYEYCTFDTSLVDIYSDILKSKPITKKEVVKWLNDFFYKRG